MHANSPSTEEAEIGGSVYAQGQPEIHSSALSQTNKQTNKQIKKQEGKKILEVKGLSS